MASDGIAGSDGSSVCRLLGVSTSLFDDTCMVGVINGRVNASCVNIIKHHVKHTTCTPVKERLHREIPTASRELLPGLKLTHGLRSNYILVRRCEPIAT